MTGLSPTLAAANRLMHNAYEPGLAGRQQREIDVQEAAGGYVLLAARVGLLETVAEAAREYRAAQKLWQRYETYPYCALDRVRAATSALDAALSAAGAATDQGGGT